MMGYRDPNDLEWEAEYWDEYILEFGLASYIEVRYERNLPERDGGQQA